MASPGDTLQTYARVVEPGLDEFGNPVPVLGLTATVDFLAGPNGPLDLGRFSWEEAGNGFYLIFVQTFATDPPGSYEAHFRFDDPEASLFSSSWTLFPAEVTATVTGGITRRDLRRTIAYMMSDLHSASSWEAGATNRIVDPVKLNRETNFFKGMQVYFWEPDGPHYGHTATITYSDGPTRTIYFEPPLQTPTALGEQVELYNFKGQGHTVSQYNQTINDVIEIARSQHALLPHTADGEISWSDAREGTVTIPDAFASVSGVRVELPSGQTYVAQPRDWSVDVFSRSITVRGRMWGNLRNRTPVIVGFARPPLLHDDNDRCAIDAEWVYNEAKAQLLERLVKNGAQVKSEDRLFLQERTEAGGKRAIIVQSFPPNTVRLV